MNKIKTLVKASNKKMQNRLLESGKFFETYENLISLKDKEGEYFFILGDEADDLICDDFERVIETSVKLDKDTIYLSILLNDYNNEYEALNVRGLQVSDIESVNSHFESYLTGSVIHKGLLDTVMFNKDLLHLQEFSFIKDALEMGKNISIVPKMLVRTVTQLKDATIKEAVEGELKVIFKEV